MMIPLDLITRGPLRAFKSRAFALYWFASVLTISSHLMFITARGWLIYELTDSPFLVTAVATVGEVPSFILSMPGGVLADRVSRKTVLIIVEIVNTAGLLMFALLIWFDTITVWHVFLLTGILGLAFPIALPARMAIVPNLVHRNQIANGVALSSIMFSGGMLVGPALAGYLWEWWGGEVAFLATAALSAISIFVLLPVRTGQVIRGGGTILSVWTDTVEGIVYTFRYKIVLGLMTIALVAIVFGSPYQVVLPVFARDVLDAGASGLGLLGAAAGLGGFSASITIATFNGPRAIRNFMVWGALAFGVALIAFALSPIFIVSALCALVAGYGFQVCLVSTTARAQVVIDDSMRGRVSAVRTMTWGAAPVGFLLLGTMAEFFDATIGEPGQFLIFGTIFEFFGTQIATAIMGITLLILSITVLLIFGSLRRAALPDGQLPLLTRQPADVAHEG